MSKTSEIIWEDNKSNDWSTVAFGDYQPTITNDCAPKRSLKWRRRNLITNFLSMVSGVARRTWVRREREHLSSIPVSHAAITHDARFPYAYFASSWESRTFTLQERCSWLANIGLRLPKLCLLLTVSVLITGSVPIYALIASPQHWSRLLGSILQK